MPGKKINNATFFGIGLYNVMCQSLQKNENFKGSGQKPSDCLRGMHTTLSNDVINNYRKQHSCT